MCHDKQLSRLIGGKGKARWRAPRTGGESLPMHPIQVHGEHTLWRGGKQMVGATWGERQSCHPLSRTTNREPLMIPSVIPPPDTFHRSRVQRFRVVGVHRQTLDGRQRSSFRQLDPVFAPSALRNKAWPTAHT